MTDDCIIDLGFHHLGGRKEAGGCVDGRLLVIELKARRLHSSQSHVTLVQKIVNTIAILLSATVGGCLHHLITDA